VTAAAAGSAVRTGFAHPDVRRLAWLNLTGGICVLASYAHGLLGSAEASRALWGGVPEAVRPLYTLNMLLAAAGYFLFTPFVLFRLPPDETRLPGGFGYRLFHALYALVLFPSALWMPLALAAAGDAGGWLFWMVRLDLAAVAVGSLGLLLALLGLRAPPAPRGRGLALAGLVPFCIQTAVLDAVIWPALQGT
jgi:hypothetical protein